MSKTKDGKRLNSIDNFVKNIINLIILLLISSSSFALVANDGPDTFCPAGAIQGSLNNASYSTLMTSYNNNDFRSVVSTPSNTIPLQIKMSKQELPNSNSNTTNSFAVNSQNSNYAININKRFANNDTAATTITLEFRNSDTLQPLYLSKVALSAFDIDASTQGSSNFDDYVKFTGVAESKSITGKIQTITGSNVVAFDKGLRTNNISDSGCSAKGLQGRCQGSVVFEEPVKSVTLTYRTTERIKSSATTNQEIDFRLDSYCYLPPSYEITKDDGLAIVATGDTTNYVIKVTNTGGFPLTNITLKDPAVSGLNKLIGISCDNNDPTNICSSVPSVNQLERAAGFNIPSLPVGKSYSIRVPTRVTAAEGSTIINTANINTANLDPKSASDSNEVTSIFGGGSSSAPATCPSGHQMYYLGESPPAYSPIQTQNLGWTRNSSNTNSFNFGSIKLTLAFSDISYLRNGYPSYSSYSGATNNAINMYHESPYAPVNHRLTATMNKPVSKFGFLVQDLDTNRNSYVESLSFDTSNNKATGGVFSFPSTFNDYLELSNNNQTIAGKRWENCSTSNPCDFNVDWGYQSAGTPFVVTHGNIYNTSSTPGQLMGYSDFYFCLAPPKLVVKKELEGNRINDTNAKRDQFEITVVGGSIAANSFTTTGTGATINNGRSTVLELKENTTYTITERVINGNANSYSASYTCTNTTTDSTTIVPSGAMSYDAAAGTRSFNLSNVNFADEITCTITNSANYVFSGIVFNDNGGIVADDEKKRDISATFTANSSYFNGLFDSGSESGISSSNLSIRLTDCSGTDIATSSPNPQTVADDSVNNGRYRFTVAPSALVNKTQVCLIEAEPSAWEYPIDTTTNVREITLVADVYNYKTEISSSGTIIRNLDFGEVKSDNAALVLIKSQYVHDCDSNLDYQSIPDSENPTIGFSIEPISDISPNNCIAYRVQAYNRAHLILEQIQISDILQNTPVASVFKQPAPLFLPTSVASPTVVYDTNGEIQSNQFSLAAVAATASTPTSATLYFNTKYGTTVTSLVVP
ncbi:DUF11 domain-containing protein [Psychrobacter jeotgali]|uniref:DUF11 domain-containing protein n=1 Tax=Psychrobacter jeotgali TaxID=179010 RepID=UPI00191B3FBE|nr:DUF11 domain-containing protein [Psychrobacter jeotgali]